MLFRVVRLQALSLKPHFHALQSLSFLCTTPHPGALNDTVFSVSALLKKPNWKKNIRLKSLVSHLNPHLVSRIIASQSRDIPLCIKFFKWVCKQSTCCYDVERRIQLLYILASDNLFGIMHKVLVWLIKECCSSQDDIWKLIVAIDDMRVKGGFRINYPCYSTLLMCLAKLDMGLIAFLVFKNMLEDGFVASGIDYRTVINALCKNGFVQAAEMFFCRVLKLGFALDVYIYTSLVLGNCRAGQLGDAFKVFALMSEKDGCGVNSATYSILVHGLCEVGRLDEASKLKEEMSEKGCQPSTRTYTVLIKATSGKGLIDQAFSLHDEMIKKRCKPNIHTYTVLVDMLCREGKIDEANGMFRKMLKDGLNPCVVTYNALINGYCKEGRIVSAFELVGVMERRQCKPNIRTCNELIEGLCKIDRPYKAVALLGKVINNGLFPTEVTFNILIVGFCRVGQLNMAFKILRYMSSFGVEPDRFSYTAFVDSLCKANRMEQAVMLTALIHGYCKSGNTRYALLLFDEMVEERFLTSPHTFNIFLDVLSKEVKLVEENAVLAKMLKHGLVPSVVTYTILVDGLCRAGDTNASLKMLELMKQANCPPNVYTYSIIIDGLCKSGKFEDAENLLIEMQKNAISPNEIIYALLIDSHVAAGRLNRAFEIVRTMLQNGCRPNNQIYFSLLAGIFMLDFFRKFSFMEMDIYHAFKLLDRIIECGGQTVDAYKFLITGLCRTGRISEADTLIQEMVKFGLTPDSDICDCIILHFCESDDYKRSLEWIERFLAYGCVPSFSSYSAVIVGLQNEGRFREADWLISNLVREAGVVDQSAISPYIDFLVNREEPCRSFEFLNFIDQIGHKERPFV
ncbi:hypothetical protein DH2020_021952 [Rehmannia glutinosa]|uniref:Pentatricopeptide repeat-containing protein n=1 Tax=Rehmannia glutinosa TaxID=99300 RepID=A0ABR0WCH2_REHGL